MLITLTTWDRIREQFDEDEKALLRAQIAGETICPRGIVITEGFLPVELAEKLRKAKEAVIGKS
jgi:hypothetical protein